MSEPKFVQITPEPIDRFRPLLGDEFDEIEEVAEGARAAFQGRAIWHISSTARGGGVAEMLHSLLPYVRGAGVDTRWAVVREPDEFFVLTKRIHNLLHGQPGDGGPLGEEERRHYEAALAADSAHLLPLTQAGDIVYLHDPQTAGLVPAMKEDGLKVVWRCHVGVDEPNELVRAAWDFLRPYVEQADAYVFSRPAYLWDGLEEKRAWFMPPVIDPFSPKNEDLGPATVQAILKGIELLHDGLRAAPVFIRGDSTPGRIERRPTLLQEETIPRGAKVVAQVSRWDRLKDPRGVLEMMEEHLAVPDLHVVLAGPESGGVADDPEGAAVYGETAEAWRRLDDAVRRRVHLISLPMYDIDENAAMVNALQRKADVIIQKSLAEGFGLTVAEAMWKRRPVVAGRVGGIQDQIVDGVTGILVDDPTDLDGFAAAIESVLADPERARQMGEAGRQRVIDHYLAIHRLREYVDLVGSLLY